MIGALVLVFLLNAVTGCGGTNKPISSGGGGGGGTGSGGAVSPGTTPGDYAITVTGTSGSLKTTATVNFTVQ